MLQCHLNESQITEHHPPLLLGLIHLPCVGLWAQTGLRNHIAPSHSLECECVKSMLTGRQDYLLVQSKSWKDLIKKIKCVDCQFLFNDAVSMSVYHVMF